MVDFSPYPEDRLEDALKLAQDAFWDVFASMFPEVETGDLDPLTTLTFDSITSSAARVWLLTNYPREPHQEVADEIVMDTMRKLRTIFSTQPSSEPLIQRLGLLGNQDDHH